MSVTVSSGLGGNARNCAARARSDSGLFVGSPSVVRLPSPSAIAATARIDTAIHAPMVRHGRLALAAARVCVESFIGPTSLLDVLRSLELRLGQAL